LKKLTRVFLKTKGLYNSTFTLKNKGGAIAPPLFFST